MIKTIIGVAAGIGLYQSIKYFLKKKYGSTNDDMDFDC